MATKISGKDSTEIITLTPEHYIKNMVLTLTGIRQI